MAKIYALYKGDEYVTDGDSDEISLFGLRLNESDT